MLSKRYESTEVEIRFSDIVTTGVLFAQFKCLWQFRQATSPVNQRTRILYKMIFYVPRCLRDWSL